MQQVGIVLPRYMTAIFLKTKRDHDGIQRLIQAFGLFASELTIVMPESPVDDEKTRFHSDKVFFIEPNPGTDSVDLLKAILRAIAVSPKSAVFFVFTNSDDSFLRHFDLKKIVRKRGDYVLDSNLGCMRLSKKYAMHIVETGDIPSTNNAIKNGFAAPMSILQMLRFPKNAIRQYSTIVKFGTVGASGIAVNLIALTLFKMVISILAANAMAQELSIVNNFVWNDRFTFRSKTESGRFFTLPKLFRFIKYNFVSLLSLSVNETVFYLAYYRLGLFYISSSLLAIAVAFVVNYFGSSRWAWAKSVAPTIKD